MFRPTIAALVLAFGMFDGNTAPAALRDNSCRMAADEPGPARRGLFRRRAMRAGRNARLAQGFVADAIQTTPPGVAVLDAQESALPLLPRQDTQVWPQAAALFPAE